MKWFDGDVNVLKTAMFIILSILFFIFLYQINKSESRSHNIDVEQNNAVINLIRMYDAKLSMKDLACEHMINKQYESCVIGPAHFADHMSLNGTITVKVKEFGKYNIQWIKKGYRAPDGKFLTSCMTSE